MVVEGRVEEVVMVSLELLGGDVVLVTDETGVRTEQSLASVAESVVTDMPDMVVEGDGVVVMTDIATSPAAATAATAGPASTERIQFGSGKVNSVDIFVDVVAIEPSTLGAETVFEVVMEGAVIVAELEVTERLGVMDSEEVEVSEAVAGGSVGVLVLGMIAGKVAVGSSALVASGTEVSLSSSVALIGVVAAAVGSTESVHISVSQAVTVLER